VGMIIFTKLLLSWGIILETVIIRYFESLSECSNFWEFSDI